MIYENDVEQPDGISSPQMTVFARGYKFMFRVKETVKDGKRQYGVFASCATMLPQNSEINIKPGELIDLGVFSPLREEDRKPLPAFLVKNFISNFRASRWAIVAGDDNFVWDLTDDTAEPHDTASERLLTYVRRVKKEKYPAIHARLDPSGKVHFLFGIAYDGNWASYQTGMQQLLPLFYGKEVEVTVSSDLHLKKKHAPSKYLQSISMFQADDIISSTKMLGEMFEPIKVTKFTRPHIERCKQVVKCLSDRALQLRIMFDEAKGDVDAKSWKGNSSRLTSVLDDLANLSKVLDDQANNNEG